MHSPETKAEFIKLRAQGRSINRAAKHLNVYKNTLLKWNIDHHRTIRCLRNVELEAFHESILASNDDQIALLQGRLHIVAAEIAKRGLALQPRPPLTSDL